MTNFLLPEKPCRNCGKPIRGYADVCPHCGVEKPVPMAFGYKLVIAVMALIMALLLVDFDGLREKIMGYFG